jgi:hypothetical protein
MLCEDLGLSFAFSTKGALYISLGQRPRYQALKKTEGLKARSR